MQQDKYFWTDGDTVFPICYEREKATLLIITYREEMQCNQDHDTLVYWWEKCNLKRKQSECKFTFLACWLHVLLKHWNLAETQFHFL